MTLFFICAAILVLLCVGWLLTGLFRTTESATDQEAVNITLARERRETLEVALAEGAIDQSTYDYEREQLEFDLAADLSLENEKSTRKGGQLSAAVLVCAFVPITAGALYLHLGSPSAITLVNSSAAENTAATDTQEVPNLAEMLPQMEQRLEQQPDDIEGWRLLGRSYLSIGEFAGARRAFERALSLAPEDVPTMAQLAESIAMLQQGALAGEPLEYVIEANRLDPDNGHALWLLSIAQQQAGDHEAALQGFDRLVSMSQGNDEALTTVNDMRNRSVAAMSDSGDTGNAATRSPAISSDQTAAEPAILVTVNVSEQALAASSPEQTVFVYATATDGPPMPLAVSRLTVADLPASITLDNSMAMIPGMTLSAFPSVTIGARISASGNAIAEAGDWFAEASGQNPSTVDSVELTISQQKP